MIRAVFLFVLAAVVSCMGLFVAATAIENRPMTWREQVIERCVAEGLLTRAGCEIGYDATEDQLRPSIDTEPKWSAL